MKLMLSFFRAYRLHTVLMLVALLLSGLAEGVGLSALLPLLNIAVGGEVNAAASELGMAAASESQSGFETAVPLLSFPSLLNLPPSRSSPSHSVMSLPHLFAPLPSFLSPSSLPLSNNVLYS